MANHDAYWIMQQQTRVKHAILGRYLQEWAAISGRFTPVLQYVDTHAGKGRYEGGEPGSPIIAMQLGQEMHDHLAKQGLDCRLHCQYVENNKEYYESLVDEVSVIQHDHPAVTWESYRGTFQDHTQEVLRRIPPNSAAFIFIDPFGYNDVAMTLILPFLVKGRKHELFVNFMVEHINRFMSDPHKHPALDRIFGTSEWREIQNEDRERERKLVMLYAQQLQRMAAAQTGREVWAYPVTVRLERQKSPFYLIHVSQNPKARHVMERATRKEGPVLQFSESKLSEGQVKEMLMEALNQRRQAKALDLAGDVWLVDARVSWEDAIRPFLKALHEGEYIVIERDGKPMKKTNKVGEKDVVKPTGKPFSNQTGLFG